MELHLRAKKEERAPVICRTANTLITDLSDSNSYCVDKFLRRLRHKGTGYFSAQCQPYKAFGTLKDGDFSESIQCNFTDSISAAQWPGRNERQSLSQSSRGHFGKNPSHIPQHLTIDVEKRSMGRTWLPPSINAGFSSINVGLCTSEWGRREIIAGDCFTNTVCRQKERKSFLHECQQAKLNQQRRQFLKTHTPSVYLNGLAVQNSYKGSLVSKNLEAVLINNDVVFRPPSCMLDESELGFVHSEKKKNVFPNYLIVALAASHFKNKALRHDVGIKLRAELVEKQMTYMLRLKTIYAILCTLYNMKTKDLKLKTPLPSEILSNLCQKPRFYSATDNNETKQRNIQRVTKSSSTTQVQPSIDLTGQYYIVNGKGPLREIPPPWQRQIIIIDGEKNVSSIEKLQSCGRKFKRSQEEMSCKLLKKMEEYDENYESRMITKLECLGNSTDAYGELDTMREKARSWKYSKKKGLTFEKPEWFLVLEQDASIHLKQPNFIMKGTAVINRMKFFTLLDLTSISHVVFVLEYVLQVKPVLFNEWMDIRKLPIPPE